MPRQPLELAPFRGLRYASPDVDRFIDGDFDVARLLAPPYDIPGPEETLELRRSDPHNATHITVPYQLNVAMPESRAGTPATIVYERAAAHLRSWIDSGVLARDPEPCLYVYEQVTAAGARQRGLIGALGLPGSEPGPIRPHEEVNRLPVIDRVRLMTSTRANLEPIFLLYPGGGGAATRITEAADQQGEPLVDTSTADGTRHRLWALISQATHSEIATDLADRSALIADGHHRYAAYRNMHELREDPAWAYGLAFLVDSETHPPSLGAIHRVVPNLDTTEAAAAARSAARVEHLAVDSLSAAEHALREAETPALLLASPEGEYHLVHDFDQRKLEQAAPAHSDAYRRLPTAALHHVLLPLWNRSDHELRMVHDDPAEAVATARGEKGTAVIVPSLRVEDVYAVTEHGELTPRKSTSFGPKPRTGLVMRVLP